MSLRMLSSFFRRIGISSVRDDGIDQSVAPRGLCLALVAQTTISNSLSLVPRDCRVPGQLVFAVFPAYRDLEDSSKSCA